MSKDKEHLARIQQAIQRLIAEQTAAESQIERRDKSRALFIQPARARTEQGEEWRLLTRDLSATGIRLIGAQRLLGQKIQVLIPRPAPLGQIPNEDDCWQFTVRILWTCEVGDDLYENGGALLDVVPPEGSSL